MEDFPIRTIEMVCLGSSMALSGLFYYSYRKKRKIVDKLKVSNIAKNDHLDIIYVEKVPGISYLDLKCLLHKVWRIFK